MMNEKKQTYIRLISTGAFLLSFVILTINGSRAGILSVVVAVMVIMGLLYFRAQLRSIAPTFRRIRPFTVGLFLLAILSILLTVVLENPFNKAGAQSLWIRWQLQIAATRMLLQTGIGVGVGNFQAAVAASGVATSGVLSPHNWLFKLIGEYGIIGTIIFLFAYGDILDSLFDDFLEHGELTTLILFSSMISFIVGGVGPSNALTQRSFWVFAALSIAAIHTQKSFSKTIRY